MSERETRAPSAEDGRLSGDVIVGKAAGPVPSNVLVLIRAMASLAAARAVPAERNDT